MERWTKEELQAELLALQDLQYQKFHSSLLPGVDNIIGVRMPLLRKLVKEMLRGDWRSYLDSAISEPSTFYKSALCGRSFEFVGRS